MRSLEKLDSWINAKVRNWSGRLAGTPQTMELLEVRRDILNQIRNQIQAKGEGKDIFPFNTIAITIAAQQESQQALLEGTLGDALEWRDTVSSLLTEAECPVPAGLQVSVSVSLEPNGASPLRPFHVQFANTKPGKEASVAKARPLAKLTVLRGEADVTEYIMDFERVNLGRLREVISDKEGLRRRNHIAFAETETTVSREHAFIRYEADASQFRLYDSMSSRGTYVFRDGRRLEVPKGPLRGFHLRSGDEIHLGDALVGFRLDDPAPAAVDLPEQ